MTTYRLGTLARRVRCEATYGAKMDYDKQSEWQRQSHGYSVRLKYKGRQMTVDYWMGVAHTGEPEARDVLDCLLSDSQAGEMSFEDFCGEFGYDEDSRTAERTWKQCAAIAEKIKRLLGDDYEMFLYSDRN